MKTKLLKKVRKRYEIRLLEKVDMSSVYHEFTPCILIVDKSPSHSTFISIKNNNNDLNKALKVAKEKLIKIIHKEYVDTKKHYTYKYKKLWYNEKIKD